MGWALPPAPSPSGRQPSPQWSCCWRTRGPCAYPPTPPLTSFSRRQNNQTGIIRPGPLHPPPGESLQPERCSVVSHSAPASLTRPVWIRPACPPLPPSIPLPVWIRPGYQTPLGTPHGG
eukprot:174975-Prorocentrum_minimum.AAC.1